jgi:ubiquinone/menaquinone biosynthesis C-methylase UbiE
MKTTELFSNRVNDYIRYRPHYPPEIISFLRNQIGLNQDSIIADIGSGTGISSEIFLQNKNKVYAIEPNNEMRKAAEEAFKGNQNFISINATAEATSLLDNSVDLIVAGQAFHWFDKAKAKKEFQRIARPGAYLALMWNDRKMETEFHQAYEKLLKEFAKDYEKVSRRYLDTDKIKDFFSPFPCYSQSFHNSQSFDFEGLKGRLLSSSYAPVKENPHYHPMIAELKRIYNEFQVNSKIEFEYNCNVYYGQI